MKNLLLGAIAMASFTAGLFFMRFWKSSQDRFFLYFAIAFWIEAMSRVMLALMKSPLENAPILYGIRLIAFGLILFAILYKNWPQKIKHSSTSQKIKTS